MTKGILLLLAALGLLAIGILYARNIRNRQGRLRILNRRGTYSSLGWLEWIFAVLLVLGAIWLAILGWGGKLSFGHDATNADAEIVELLTVKTSNVDCTAIASKETVAKVGDYTLVQFQVASVAKKSVKDSNDADHRKWNNAISTPVLAANDKPEAQLLEMKVAICRDPLLGVSWAHYFTNLTVRGHNLADLNEWLRPYKGLSADQVNDKAMAFAPLYFVTDASKVTPDQAKNAAEQNVAYQRLAGYLGTLLDRFTIGDVNSTPSIFNLDLVTDTVVGTFPEVQVNDKQESLPARHLLVTIKGVCVPAFDGGFNLGDKRPETFPEAKCSSPSPSTPTTNKPECKDKDCEASQPPDCKKNNSCGGGDCVKDCDKQPPKSPPCNCVDKTQAAQPNPTAPKQEKPVPTKAPPANPTTAPAPIVTGVPTPVDTQTHNNPIPTPTGGPFG